MNLSVKKLRRSATVVGGTFLGLGIVAAMAAPALACDTKIDVDTTCATDNGWTATWHVQNDWHVQAIVRSVTLDGQEVSFDNLKKDTTVIKADYTETVTAESKFTGAAGHRLEVELQWAGNDGFNGPTDSSPAYATPKTRNCETHSTPPSSAPPSSTPPSSAPPSSAPPSSTAPSSGTPSTTTPGPSDTPTIPIPSESAPALPGEIYKADCSSVTIGLDNTNTPIEYVLTFKPKSGASQTLDIKPGEKKSAKFAVSGQNFYVNMTVVAKYKGQTSPAETAAIPYERPASCSSEALAVTGSSSLPLAGGALAVLLVGGGIFFVARRRKIRFTA